MSPLTCLHMNGHNLSTLAFPCTPVEEQTDSYNQVKGFKKKKKQSNTAELAKSRRTENTDLKISLLLLLLFQGSGSGFLWRQLCL